MTAHSFRPKRSLVRLLLGSITAVMAVLLFGSLVSNALTSRDYIEKQLQAHSRDAANSLGLSLSTVVDARDRVLAGRMIDAIFDSGDFSFIRFTNAQGELVHEVRSEPKLSGVPEWFSRLFALDLPAERAKVMSGWSQLGELEVQSLSAPAYQEMWRAAKSQIVWFILVLFIAIGLVMWLMVRALKPLKDVEEQARQLSLRNFDFRLPEPETRELARVANTMNSMSETLGELFSQQLSMIESLRARSLLDALTGLNNREGFDHRLKTELDSHEHLVQGSLFLLNVHDFAELNRELGREEADRLLQSIAAVLNEFCKHHDAAFAARRGGANFALFCPHVLSDMLDEEAASLMSKLNSLSSVRQLLRDNLLHLGLAAVVAEDDSSSLLARADLALRGAQGAGVSGWQRYAELDGSDAEGQVLQANEWHSLLQKALAEKNVELHMQTVFAADQVAVVYRQMLARLRVNDELVPASVFIPMAKRFDLMVSLDRIVFEKILASFGGQDSGPVGVSFSEDALMDEAFVDWVAREAEVHPQVFSRLLVHVPEHVLRYGEKSLLRLSQVLDRAGAGLVIERFGVSSVPFSYLQRLNVAYIRVDRSFVRQVHENSDRQFFLRSAVQLAHSQGVKVLAVGVESEPEAQWLRDIEIDGLMGYLLQRPEALAV